MQQMSFLKAVTHTHLQIVKSWLIPGVGDWLANKMGGGGVKHGQPNANIGDF